MLKRKTRERIRELARDVWVYETADLGTVPADSKSYLFQQEVIRRRDRSRGIIKDRVKQEFGSGILTSLLLSLMMKLAMKYIEEWISDHLFSSHVPRKFSNPRSK